jgi:inactivated superfamily I helicase
VRRWIGDQTFAPESASSGVRLLDDQAARYGSYDDITIVGLIESEWPDRPRRNIFYPPNLLRALNWPSEKDRRGAADARFLELVASASSRVELSVFLLDGRIDRRPVDPAGRSSPRAALDDVASLDVRTASS